MSEPLALRVRLPGHHCLHRSCSMGTPGRGAGPAGQSRSTSCIKTAPRPRARLVARAYRHADNSDGEVSRMNQGQVSQRALEFRDAEQLLATHHTGRMAFAFHNRVVMTLVNYVYSGGWIYARLEHGPALSTLEHHQWVAFEVDEIIGVYDWRTVIVHGSVQFLK